MGRRKFVNRGKLPLEKYLKYLGSWADGLLHI